jgi:hypothetical protein
MAVFQPSDSLRSRTFVGLLIAQFFAAFNDQAIHASAMFFAMRENTLQEKTAIQLMPILFYAPWALFATLAGYFADRYSKRASLVFWKVAEIGITLVALLGFWLGTHGFVAGPFLVLSTVFLMGTHSAFFVPAKYGAMPEILQPHMLSRGNGLLESLSFLAVILGTVFGGILSDDRFFGGREYWIGVILVGLAVLGALASLLIRRMPAANPGRAFPRYVYQPLWESLRVLWRSRPLAFAVIGIAFFTFLVAFMRATVYLHGEAQPHRWSEIKTSIVVGMVALGIGLGSPLVGFLSGSKVELGLVPIGAVGMIVATVIAAIFLGTLQALIPCIIAIGFFTGFYIVPLFTLLQHRAPKASKGDAVATSNFINVTGAIAASLLMMVLTFSAERSGIAPQVPQQEGIRGVLEDFTLRHGRPIRVVIDRKELTAAGEDDEGPATAIDSFGAWLHKGDHVIETRYLRDGVVHHRLRRSDKPLQPVYDESGLPRLFFLGAGGMTLLTLLVLWQQLPDLFGRTLLWLRALRDYRLEVAGMNHLPGNGPVVLATNAESKEECQEVLAATDRTTRFLCPDGVSEGDLARRAGDMLRHGEVVGLPLGDVANGADALLDEAARAAPVLPVWHAWAPSSHSERRRRVYVFAGRLLPAGTPAEEVRRRLRQLGDEFKERGREVFDAERALSAGAHG